MKAIATGAEKAARQAAAEQAKAERERAAKELEGADWAVPLGFEPTPCKG